MLWLVLWTGHNGSIFSISTHRVCSSIFKIASMCLLFDETFNLPECDFYIISVKPSGAASSQVVCKIACCSHITLTWYSLLPPALPHLTHPLFLWAPGSRVVNVSLVFAAECQQLWNIAQVTCGSWDWHFRLEKHDNSFYSVTHNLNRTSDWIHCADMDCWDTVWVCLLIAQEHIVLFQVWRRWCIPI